jgi:hypothetical protein
VSSTLVSTPTAPARTSATGRGIVIPQLGLGRILGTWAAAALPMAALAWIVAPWLADRLSGPAPLGQALLIALTAGLVWQGALVAGLVAAEQRTLRFSVVREALWLAAADQPAHRPQGRPPLAADHPLILAFGMAHELPTPAHPAGARPRHGARHAGRRGAVPRRLGLVRARPRHGRVQHRAR